MSTSLSILMPVHNAAATLKTTLPTLAAQTVTDVEWVVVDDGSEDESVKLIRDYIPNGVQLKLLQPGRVGLVPALQEGLTACSGTWVARMDADDLMAPHRLEAQLAFAAENPQLQVISSQVQSFRDDPNEELGEGYALYDAWINELTTHEAIFRERFVESPIPHPSAMFLKSAIDEIGGYQDHGWPEDYDLWLRAMHHGLQFGKVPEVLLYWRDQEGRTSRVDPRYHAYEFLKCKAHYLSCGPLKKKQTVIWGAGPIGKRLGRYLEENGVSIVAYLDIDPKKIGTQRRGVEVVSASELQSFEGTPLITAVGARGARTLIREELRKANWVEGVDYHCAA